MNTTGSIRPLSGKTNPHNARADELLRSAELLGRMRGVYSDLHLTRKIRRETRKNRQRSLPASHDMNSIVVDMWLDELIRIGRLSAVEEECFRLFFAGQTARRIASELRLSYRIACRRLASARVKLQRAFDQGPHAGWQEVYLAEVHRYVYRAPRSGQV